MNEKLEKIKYIKTKSGKPALWEKGGGYTNTGEATIVASASGEKKAPLYIRKSGPLACSEHALIPIQPGDHIVVARHHRRDFFIEVLSVLNFDTEHLVCVKKHSYENGEWDSEPSPQLFAAVEAAKRKATAYHCREPYYVQEEVVE